MHITYVYMLQEANQKLSVGYTDDIRRDIFARRQEPRSAHMFTLVYYETLTNHRSAIDRFIELKRLPKLKKIWLIQIHNPMWDDLSREWNNSRPNYGE